jgi:multiple sugar transport system substrate-binding protein
MVSWLSRKTVAAAVAIALGLGLSACGGGGGSDSGSGSAQKFDPNKEVTITFWSGFTSRELRLLNGVIADFEKKFPNVTVNSVGGINDDKITAAIRGGNAPDVALSFSSDNTGAFCSSGAWIDLQPYIDRDHVDIGAFPKAVQQYTEYQGTRCAMPLLADDYGLYYNKDLLANAGIKSAPRTISELTADAKKLTQRGSDGSIEVAGYVPSDSFYESVPAHYAPQWNAQWFDGNKSAVASDPAWADYLRWSKGLIDWYGSSDLTKFEAGAGAEFSASNAFENGKIAMMIDGEYRTAFIKAEHPELNYGTAPFPVADNLRNRYGAGYVTGSIVGIPKGSSNEGAAWELIKYLTTNPTALAKLGSGLANVPTTQEAANSPLFKPPAHFAPFLKIFTNPYTQTNPMKASGAAYQELFQSFVDKWEAGDVSDLHSGLEDTASQIDAQEANAAGGGPP